MSEAVLTPQRILEAAEDVLRRYGPAKANVVDVARALGVSHGSVYRHFESKAALRDAVTDRWLARVSAPLEMIATEDGPAAERLHRWLVLLSQTKREKALDEPELFATYLALAAGAREVVDAHVDHLVELLTRIIADGAEQDEFTVDDPETAARAVFDATARFHNPAFASQWSDPGLDDALERVWALVLGGLQQRHGAGRGVGVR
ncbi:MAG: TetR family transcriptional regulator [Thermoleophilaceae bacterium]|nr:TetR family transcriptional regulator [Thermoleophilaceae bacterium]